MDVELQKSRKNIGHSFIQKKHKIKFSEEMQIRSQYFGKIPNQIKIIQFSDYSIQKSTITTEQMNDLLINSQGQVYINSSMKLLTISLMSKRRFLEMSKQLQTQLEQCSSNKCLQKVQKKLKIYEQKKQQFEKYFQERRKKMEYEYILCNDMIYENDIRICRKQVKDQAIKDMGYFINKEINFSSLVKNINLPN